MSNGILASEISVQLTQFPTDVKLYQHVRNVSLTIGRACVEMAKDIALFRSVGVKPPNAEVYTALLHHTDIVFVKVSDPASLISFAVTSNSTRKHFNQEASQR